MNSQLQQSSVNQRSLKSYFGEREAIAEGRVRSESLQEEMSLIGFIPYSFYSSHYALSVLLDLNVQPIVSPHLVKLGKDAPIIPIFKTARGAKGNKYEVDKKLLIDPILDRIPEKILKRRNFKLPLTGQQFLQQFMGENWDKSNLFEMVDESPFPLDDASEDKRLCYIGQENEWELTGGIDGITCISNDFLCLCSYMNKITGQPSYAVLTSSDTIRVLPENEDK